MRRGLLVLLMAFAPVATLMTTTGCEQEVKSVRSEERVEQSEPQMTSPGTEVLE